MDSNDMTMTKSLPHELVVEILSRLPIKYLWPFRCVCKTWLRLLIADPHFAILHFHRSIESNSNNNNPSILALHKTPLLETDPILFLAADYSACGNTVHLELPFHRQDTTDYMVHGFCNGLLCLSNTPNKNHVYVWNPFTRDHITIPSPVPPTLPPFLIPHITTVFGFGFHQATHEYKLIQISSEADYLTGRFRTHVSVYTLGTDSSWRTVEDLPYYVSNMESHCPFLNGALHCLACKPLSYCDLIVSFDLKDEVFHEIQLPPNVVDFDDGNPPKYNMMIGETGGFICIFGIIAKKDVQVWVMKEYGVVSSWTKQSKIGLSEEWRSFAYLGPLGVAHNREVLLKKNNRELILYDPETSSARNLNEFGFEFYDAYTFIGSIVSPKVISGVAGTS